MMTYGLIGERLGHSFSRDIHNRLDSYEYILREVPREEFADFMTRRQFKAINVTIPYKQEVIPFLDEISDTAQTIGAVNTIVNRDGKLCGYNTDFGGMKALLSHAGISLEGRKVLICGTGGTSKTAMAVAQHLGASAVYRASRSGRDGALTYTQVYEQHADTQVIINTTPCGMYPEAEGMPVDPRRFDKLEGAIDAIYNPLRTPFVRAVQSMGIPAEGGLYMLVMQAVLAWEIFTGGKCAPETADKIYNDLFASRTNIVLVGMPGSGKSTVGKMLAQSLGRPFIDTDSEITSMTGREITDIFEKDGEAVFRDIESQAVSRAALSTGAVIATGGGAVLRGENVDALRANGRIFFIDRPIEDIIPTSDRPLANSADAVRRRFEERQPIYISAADRIVKADKSAQAVAAEIEEEFVR